MKNSIIVLLLLVSGGVCSAPTLDVSDFNIRKDEIAMVTADALNGSGAAAHRLAMYCQFLQLDTGQTLFWERIAAENGDNAAFMYDYAVLLNGLPNVDQNERLRVKFWLRKAAALGDKKAQETLSRLN